MQYELAHIGRCVRVSALTRTHQCFYSALTSAATYNRLNYNQLTWARTKRIRHGAIVCRRMQQDSGKPNAPLTYRNELVVSYNISPRTALARTAQLRYLTVWEHKEV